MGYYGIENYYYGPKLHQFLHEIHEKAFAPHDAFSVGETPGLGMKMCQLVTGEEAKGYYAEYLKQMSENEAFAKILAGTREHTRVLLPWNEKMPAYHEGLTQTIRKDVTEVYKELIGLRHADLAFVYGDFTVLNKEKDRFIYQRSLDDREYIVDCNLGKEHKKALIPNGYQCIFTTGSENDILLPYEARIWKNRRKQNVSH